MADRKVNIIIKATDEASRVFENVANNALPQFARRVAQASTAFLSVAAIEETVRRAFSAALEAEKATAGLTAALQAQGTASRATVSHLTDHAEALSRVSLADDEAIQGAQKVLISIGGLMGPKLDETTQAALDLSAGLGIDLTEAATMVGKAAQGSVKPFTMLGFEFKGLKTDGEKLDAVLAGIQERFGGMAAAELGTSAGQIHELEEAWGELLETLGKKAIGGVEGISRITKAWQDLNDEANKPRTSGFWNAIATKIVTLGDPKGLVAADVARAAAEMQKLSDNMAEDRLENPMIGFSDAAQVAADKVKAAKDAVAALALAEAAAAKEAERHAKDLAKMIEAAHAANFIPGISTFQMSPFEARKRALQEEIDKLHALKMAYDAAHVGGFSITSEPGGKPFAIENQGPAQLPEDRETDAAKRLVEQLNAVKAAREAAHVGGFGIVTEPGGVPQAIENQGPTQPPEDAARFQELIDQANALRDAEVALDAPVRSVAESWSAVLSVVERLAAAMPKEDTAGLTQIRHLIDVARVQEERVASLRFASPDERLEGTRSAVAALQEAIAAISYLTPKQKEEFAQLTASMLGAGKRAESLGTTMKDAFTGAVTQAAVQLGDTLVDAAFGAKVAWDEALQDILKGLIKAVIQALIMKLITTAIAGGASGGGFVGASGVGPHASASQGGIVPAYAHDGAVAERLLYAAGGATVATIFKPRGTDTVPAMLTPGERVLTVGDTRAVQSGEIVIAARSSKEARTPGARPISGSGGSLVAIPAGRGAGAPPVSAAPAPTVITIRAPRQVAQGFDAGGFVSGAFAAPAFAAGGDILTRTATMRPSMLMPADATLPDGVAYQDLAGPAASARAQAAVSPRARDESGEPDRMPASRPPPAAPAPARTQAPLQVNVGGRRFVDLLITHVDGVIEVNELIEARKF